MSAPTGTVPVENEVDAANEVTVPAQQQQQVHRPRSHRASHTESLMRESQRALQPFALSPVNGSVDAPEDELAATPTDNLVVILEEGGGEVSATQMSERDKKLRQLHKRLSVYQDRVPERLVEVRMKDFSYYIPIKADAPTVKTVGNQSICYAAYEFFRRLHQYRRHVKESRHTSSKTTDAPNHRRSSRWSPVSASDILLPFDKKPVLSDINLVLKPGRTYLVLGPPESGKTTLLKAIAGRLPVGKNVLDGKPSKNRPHQEGRIEYNGVAVTDDPSLVLPNVVSFVGQLDIHAPYLTVKETFDFAFQSRTGGKHENIGIESEHLAAEFNEQHFTENLTIEGLDLSGCADTFVGNSDVRGISGGQRRRVTVGEMMQDQNPVACADEISTGLDAAVTYDIVHSIVTFAKAAKTTRVVSLLQPGPETFCLFDEVILLAKGYVIYSGPIDEVVAYFESLGYKQSSTIDVADFLQLIPTPDGAMLFDAASSPADEHYSAEGFATAFTQSDRYKQIVAELEAASRYDWTKPKPSGTGTNAKNGVPPSFKVKYQNSFFRTTRLNLSRHFTLWKRDKAFIIGKLFENIGMAVATGGILFGSGRISWDINGPIDQVYADDLNQFTAGVYGALFMTTFHILLGTMTSAPDEIDGRSIHYKHCDANFYQTFAFVFGRLISTIPQRTIEILAFGIPLYWMVGLDASASSFFTYIALLVCYTTGVKMMFSILAQSLPKKASVQGVGTFVVLLLTLFGGFIVNPKSVPSYYLWIYWASPMSWALQGLVSTEFTSSKYNGNGDIFLTPRGFQTGREWVGYSFAYMIPFTLLCTVILGFILKRVRIEPEKQHIKKKPIVKMGRESAGEGEDDNFNLPFIPVDLTFKNLTYEVDASTSGEKLRLLNEVSGTFTAGRMCALMGSSGAGKTTLMDVIAMRKTSGTITGEISLNGFPQERTSFLRCSGYVEQFDVQQAELTVRETVVYCARLRLDAKDPAIVDDDGKLRYVDHVLETMELTDIQTLQVGNYEEGGLSFEQRKRLAIACELAGSPSVIFLDEPTSGLDSRGALVVMRAMKRIAEGGRTVCATIHQPSSAVFEMFDDLLLLKKGGNVVFFGELGHCSDQLVNYFEARGAKPIEFGENPASWMLRAYAGENTANSTIDYAELYKSSEQYTKLLEQIELIIANRDETKKIHYDEMFSTTQKERLQYTNQKITTIYKRSPAYNLTRLVIAIFYSFLIGSVFIRNEYGRNTTLNESVVDGLLGTIFLSTIIIGVTSISMAVPVMKKIRDVFYKHRASGMLEHNSLSWALSVGEVPYILMVSLLFGVVYYFTVGLFTSAKQFWYFYLFFTLNVAIYAFFGQAFICVVSDVPTSGALVGALIGYNVFFSGYIVKPQYFVGPFQLGFWTAPGRFAYEGIVSTQFRNLKIPVIADPNSPFFFSLNCTTTDEPCEGTIDEYSEFAFGGRFTIDNFWLDVGALLGYVVLARLLTWYALKRFNYVNT